MRTKLDKKLSERSFFKVGQFKTFIIDLDLLGTVSRAVTVYLCLCFWCECIKLSRGEICLTNFIAPANGASRPVQARLVIRGQNFDISIKTGLKYPNIENNFSLRQKILS